MYWRVNTAGELTLIEGAVFDAEANADSPWFITHDTDWDVSNDTPCTEEEYEALGSGYVRPESVIGGFVMTDYVEMMDMAEDTAEAAE